MKAPVEMQERIAPSRPTRLGTRRRSAAKAGGGHAGAKRPLSLDTEKQVETSVRDWMRQEESPADIWRSKWNLHNELERSVYGIWQGYARRAKAQPDAVARVTLDRQAAKWEKTWLQLNNCQSQWVGYRAKCCGGKTTPVAIPIGCNHRLCPLCCHIRSLNAQRRIRKMFDRLTHPALITLTIPNLLTIRKHDYTLFRQRVRKFIKQQSGWIKGGVYSLETTYNRQERTWHIHVHILADLASSLPSRADKVTLAGESVYRFTAIKLRLEYDWLRLWGAKWGKKPRTDARADVRLGDEYNFEEWVRLTRRMRLKEFRAGGWRAIEGVSARVLKARSKWNAQNRRVIDLRPVLDRDAAAREVLKYITKVAQFSDMPEALEPFIDAVKGARLIQTFGSWYGVALDDAPDEAEQQHGMQCSCGCNDWKRMGIFYHRDVQLDPDGRWRLRPPHDHNSRGTVPRPTIRALDVREE